MANRQYAHVDDRYKVILIQPPFSLRTTTIVLRNASSGKQLIVDGLGIARGPQRRRSQRRGETGGVLITLPVMVTPATLSWK